jgi:hypothetical protein
MVVKWGPAAAAKRPWAVMERGGNLWQGNGQHVGAGDDLGRGSEWKGKWRAAGKNWERGECLLLPLSLGPGSNKTGALSDTPAVQDNAFPTQI